VLQIFHTILFFALGIVLFLVFSEKDQLKYHLFVVVVVVVAIIPFSIVVV
jgi:hypothetical protein